MPRKLSRSHPKLLRVTLSLSRALLWQVSSKQSVPGSHFCFPALPRTIHLSTSL
ncbi:hypothetical protein M378DRAFT_166222 [Amanita muscaria Koide BX008]|uniref:Uncharacterized protein n=1 Tax=Amanita muscaria (strain Koide BX008) TaxID=946122 RepID=A0A0C2WKK9_AMAMK|nr:hypothetical protein M378DRAFT_166222 [Amanita muscaria Koide BX008]